MCDVAHHAMTPTTVKQAGAGLVYKKKPIANIMIGRTGKSVVARLLDGLS